MPGSRVHRQDIDARCSVGVHINRGLCRLIINIRTGIDAVSSMALSHLTFRANVAQAFDRGSTSHVNSRMGE